MQTFRKMRFGRWTAALLAVLTVVMTAFGTARPVMAEEENPEVLRVGLEANYAPFNWSQTNDKDGAVPISNSPGEYANGYDVWMAKQIADGLGRKLEIVKVEWDGLMPSLISGKIDAIIAGMSPTAERKETIDFTDNYYNSDLVLVVKKDSKYKDATSLADFAGARVTGQLNTFHYTVIDQIPDVQKVTAMDSFPTMISSLLADKIDAYVSERPGAMAAVAANPSLTYIAFEQGKGFTYDPENTSVAIGVRKGSPLVSSMNDILAKLPESDRQQAMQHMIDIQVTGNAEGAEKGFFAVVGDLLNEYGSLFARGAGITMFISIISTTIGFLIGLVVQVLRSIPIDKKDSTLRKVLVRILRFILTAYIEIFRGTPMMVQAMLIYYGGKLFFNLDMSALGASLIIVSVNTGAYLAEVIRGGIDSVDAKQLEACKAIGLTHGQSMRHVILPQTIKAILPAIGNEFVVNIKDTSVLNVISVTELFFVTKSVAGTTYKIFQAYLITAVIYFILTFVTTRIINWLGRRSGQTKPFTLTSVTGGNL